MQARESITHTGGTRWFKMVIVPLADSVANLLKGAPLIRSKEGTVQVTV